MDIYPQYYYVYFYLRDDFTPYYIGKGMGKRALEKGKGEVYPPRDKSKIIFVEQNLTELQAFIFERYYIRWFGRKDIGTGILRNKTDGGEGSSGTIVSENTKKKISEKAKILANKRIENNTHNFQKREDGSSLASERAEKGTNPFCKREDGSSLGSDNAKRMLSDGNHPFQRRSDGTSMASDMVKTGKSAFIKKQDGTSINTGMVVCVNKQGIKKRISVDFYKSQIGIKENWEWVHQTSKEAKSR
nr:MAG: hypothetical protein [Caudoviricetes sp.]